MTMVLLLGAGAGVAGSAVDFTAATAIMTIDYDYQCCCIKIDNCRKH